MRAKQTEATSPFQKMTELTRKLLAVPKKEATGNSAKPKKSPSKGKRRKVN